eukprot:2922671-Pleurochrysis_carterae.AAC.1
MDTRREMTACENAAYRSATRLETGIPAFVRACARGRAQEGGGGRRWREWRANASSPPRAPAHGVGALLLAQRVDCG